MSEERKRAGGKAAPAVRPDKAAEKEARLAAALRANLRRRKAQADGRRDEPEEKQGSANRNPGR